MQIETFYDPATFTLTFAVFDEKTRDAVIIDPVLDFDPIGAKTSTESVDKLIEFVKGKELKVHYVLETHAHADHLSASQILKKELGAKVAIGRTITEVQKTFAGLFDIDFPTDGSQFDHLIDDGEKIVAGSLEVEAIATPGHTPACMTFKIDDAIFTGDALFMDDYGTGRCDFPRGSADELYTSIHERLYNLPDDTRVFVGHDYQPGGREVAWETTIGKSKKNNPQLKGDTDRATFVEMRESRDATLRAPRLLFQSVQVNANAGVLPKPHENGMRYLVTPLNLGATTDDTGRPA